MEKNKIDINKSVYSKFFISFFFILGLALLPLLMIISLITALISSSPNSVTDYLVNKRTILSK